MEDAKTYKVELEGGDVIDSGLSLLEAEMMLCRCCDDGLDAHIVDE